MKPTKRGPQAVFFARLFVVAGLALTSCATGPAGRPPVDKGLSLPVPTDIMGRGSVREGRLSAFLTENNPRIDPKKAGRLARYYIEEGRLEGVNADIAFVQMCLETGFLSFKGDVTESMNNFCGLGTVGGGQKGNSFPDERTGVRAHIQHLKGYASSSPLAGSLVDPRYKYINPKGKAPTVQGLSGTWAADRQYGDKLEGLLVRLYRSGLR